MKFTIREFKQSDITYNKGKAGKYFMLIDEILKLREDTLFTIPLKTKSEVTSVKRGITLYYYNEPMYKKYHDLYRIDLRQSGTNLIVCKAKVTSKREPVFRKVMSNRKISKQTQFVGEEIHPSSQCVVCGDTLTGNKTLYCSIECNHKAYRERQKDETRD